MLYMLKSFGPNNVYIYKIGYSSNFKKRLNQYIGHNPYIEVLQTRESEGD